LKPLTGLLLFLFLGWYFSDILAYIIIAAVISLLGRPLVQLLQAVHIRKIKLNAAISAAITLLSFIFIVSLFVLFIVPLISDQANMIANIDNEAVSSYFATTIADIQQFMISYGFIDNSQDIMLMAEKQLSDFLDLAHFTNFFGQLLSATSGLLMGTFIVMFLSFFFLKEPQLLRSFILALVPEPYEDDVKLVMTDSRRLLTRYFLGILLELTSMMTLIGIGLTIFGVKNALVIGFLGGLMNIIPYLGPIIGATLGMVLGVISVLSLAQYDLVFVTLITILGVFAGANLVDNIVLQPLIYSKSVKAHPVEIFLVIIMAGKVAGIGGMIIAIPTYTVLRVLARQFLSQIKIVKVLTGSMQMKQPAKRDTQERET
jgi:predicted PurR-regulated permease PerM